MNWFILKYEQARFNLEMRAQYQRDTILNFFYCLKWWLAERPRKVKCDFCGNKIWFWGRQDSEVYCNENCAYYGPYEKEQENDIPF